MRTAPSAVVLGAFLGTAVASLPLPAQLAWRDRAPSARFGHAFAYDTARAEWLLFGGTTLGTRYDDTWTFDGSTWTQRLASTRPSPRDGAAVAHDAARGVTVLHGGGDGSSALDGTWLWDGAVWNAHVGPGPGPRFGHAMAFDRARGRVVLFGGAAVGSELGDTWEWDGTAWMQRTPATRPPARLGHALAFDTLRARTVMFGGVARGLELGDTWEWDGNDWVARPTAFAPPTHGPMAFDECRGRTVLLASPVAQPRAQTWTWDGNAWTQLAPPLSPPAPLATALAYDAARQRVVLAGGLLGVQISNQRWSWDGVTWTAESPPPSTESAVAWDHARARLVLFGGDSGADTLWEWDGARWSAHAPAVRPVARRLHALVYDSASRTTLLFGGATSTAGLRDLWSWDGNAWQELHPATTAPLPTGRSLADDVDRRRLVLFEYGQTWEWDGSDWTQRSPAHAPPGRYGAAMCYDRVHRRTLLFGGALLQSHLADTWEWDGSDWVMRQPNGAPPARWLHDLVWDAARRRVVLAGGNDLGNVRFADTWEWNGVDWQQRSAAAPDDRGRVAAIGWDGSRVVHFARGVAWAWDPEHDGALRTIGAGCAGSGGVPVLRAEHAPIVGASAFALEVWRARVLSPVVVGLSPLPDSTPLPGGCTLYARPPLIELHAGSDASGTARSEVAIPWDSALGGARVFVQGFVLDPQGAFLQLAALSAGLELRIGD